MHAARKRCGTSRPSRIEYQPLERGRFGVLKHIKVLSFVPPPCGRGAVTSSFPEQSEARLVVRNGRSQPRVAVQNFGKTGHITTLRTSDQGTCGNAVLEIDPVARRHPQQVSGAPDDVILELA